MVAVHADSFHSLQSGKGNKTADWVACGASKSLSCRHWDAASSPAPKGWVPDEGILSGSPRLCLVLKVLARFFQIWRIAFLIESALLVFDAAFDFSNFASTRPGADRVFILFAPRANGTLHEVHGQSNPGDINGAGSRAVSSGRSNP
jgi:hypothetical protein